MINQIIDADSLYWLKKFNAGYFDSIITSPPYFDQRIYTNDRREVGKERNVSDYVDRLLLIFRECKRILKETGTFWLVVGDKYARRNKSKFEVPSKSLSLVPQRLALALVKEGWILRNDIIWHKSNPMPESVKDRCTSSYEHVFLFVKSDKYTFNSNEIKTRSKVPNDPRGFERKRIPTKKENGIRKSGTYEFANPRDVWKIPVQPFKEAHTATFPEELVRRCLLTGSNEGDLILDPFCGAGTVPLVALQNKRNYLGIDVNSEYVDLARSRLKKWELANV